MNIESVKSIFRLFSGDEDIGKYTPLTFTFTLCFFTALGEKNLFFTHFI